MRAKVDVKAAFVVGLCAYEQGAIVGGKWPTITRLCREHPVVFAGAVGLLTWHIWFERGAPFGRPA